MWPDRPAVKLLVRCNRHALSDHGNQRKPGAQSHRSQQRHLRFERQRPRQRPPVGRPLSQRTLHDRARVEWLRLYPKHLLQTVRPKLERVAGVRGLYLLWRGGHDEVQYQVLTLSDSRQAIRAFAGEQLNHAVVEPEARAALVRFDSDVSHFEVFAGPTV